MSRFVDDDGSILRVLDRVLEDRFPWLQVFSFLPIFDTRKREVYGNIRLADIMLTSEKVKFFTRNKIITQGYDFVLTVDVYAWKFATSKDKMRLVSHELQHAVKASRGRASIRGHDIEDFYEEIERNKDDPEWGRRLARKVRKAYIIQEAKRGKKKAWSAG